MKSTFVHLNVHTEYSLVDSLVRIKELVAATRNAGMPAVAVTEQGNLFSLVKFYQAARSAGIKPIVGVDVRIHDHNDPNTAHNLILLCRNVRGYQQLSRLVSRTFTDGRATGKATVLPEWLEKETTDGLIALSGGPMGDIGRALAVGRVDDAARRLEYWQTCFPDRFYLEIHRTGKEGEEAYIDQMVDLAVSNAVPLVASNDVRFLAPQDFEAHEARVCIHDGRVLNDPRRPRKYTTQQYLRSAEEMNELFSDLPEAIENSVEIAKRCSLELELGESYLPVFPVPDGKTESEWFESESNAGLELRLKTSIMLSPADQKNEAARYHERLRTEMEVINSKGFAGYFLIVADFVNWAKRNGVPVGPGRGSGAGSLVAYSLGITELDPIHYDLLFERFLNPERVSLPDFDVDFCMEGRDRVIEYVTERYGGNEFVSQIITFGSMAAKAVVRDVGRVLGHPYGFVDLIAKLVPFELGMTLERALKEEDLLKQRYEDEEEVRTLIDLALKLEGISRNAGRHAGGVVISPTPLTEFTALYCEQGASGVVTQLDKNDVESVGLVKFDFLGLRTLTIIDWAVTAINRERRQEAESPLDITRIPLDDEASYELIRRCATTAVFQFESRVMKDLTFRLQPARFDDIIALNALIRPGPSLLADDFIDRRHGRARITYMHPDLEVILKSTYGIILYQEQVMQIAQVLAGYTLGAADILRSAMGKKKPEEMAKQREVFVSGAVGHSVDRNTASHIFDLMEKFAGYGFNKSHSAAYALVAFQTAWLKTHYPAHFMAAVLSSDMDNTDKVVTLINESRDMRLEVLAPDVNYCAYHFTAETTSAIRYGLGAIKGVGQAAIEAIIEERKQNGLFTDLFDFCRRVDLKKANRRVMEALIRSGSLDGLSASRATMMASLTSAMQAAEQLSRDRSSGQNDMFGEALPALQADFRLQEAPEWSESDRLSGEKDTLGLYLTGHPITEFQSELDQFVEARLVDLKPSEGRIVLIAGLVVSLRTMNTRFGRMAVLTLDDRSARVEVKVYSDLYQTSRDILVKDRLLIARGEVTQDEVTGNPAMTADEICDLDTARALFARQLVIRISQSRLNNGFINDLSNTLAPFKHGDTPVAIEYQRGDACGRLYLGNDWRVRPAQELLNRLRELDCPDRVEIGYQ